MKQMRDRLIKMLCGVKCKGVDRWKGGCIARTDGECVRIKNLEMCMVNKIADDLLANGVIVPPCKVGDTVWVEIHGQIESARIYHCTYELSSRGIFLSGAYAKDTNGFELCFNGNSKAVFLTREEAEQALKGERT